MRKFLVKGGDAAILCGIFVVVVTVFFGLGYYLAAVVDFIHSL